MLGKIKKGDKYFTPAELGLLMDQEDEKGFLEFEWSINNSGYVTCSYGSFHVLIMNPPNGFEIDHIDRNKLNCKKENLRIVTHSQNHFNTPVRKDNTSKVKGVTWRRDTQTWQAQIMVRGRNIHLGTFKELELAIQARKTGEEQYHAI